METKWFINYIVLQYLGTGFGPLSSKRRQTTAASNLVHPSCVHGQIIAFIPISSKIKYENRLIDSLHYNTLHYM